MPRVRPSAMRRRGLSLVPTAADALLRTQEVYASFRPGGTAKAYVGAPPELLLCPCCGDVYEDAVLLPCGHSHCRTCATLPALRNDKDTALLPEATDASCTICSVTWHHAETPSDVARGRSAYDVLRVLCCHGLRFVATEEEAHVPPNRRTRVVGLGVDGNDGSKFAALEPGGCREVMLLKDKEAHEAECPFRPVFCGLCDDHAAAAASRGSTEGGTVSLDAHECRARVRFKDLEAHRLVCTFRRVVCGRCGGTYVARRQAEHDAACEMCACPLGCGALCRRGEGVSTHVERDCPRALIFCGNYAVRGAEVEDTAAPKLAPWPRVGEVGDGTSYVRTCGYACRRCDMPRHQRDECPYRLRTCEHCGEGVSAAYLKAHAQRCPEALIPCPNACGVSLRRRNLKHHLAEECQVGATACPYAHIGCQARYVRADSERHLTSNVHNHLAMVAERVESMHTTFEAMRESVWALNESVENQAKASEERHRLLEMSLADVLEKQRNDFANVCADMASLRDHFFTRLEDEAHRWETRTTAESVGFQRSYRGFAEAHERLEGLVTRLEARSLVAANLEKEAEESIAAGGKPAASSPGPVPAKGRAPASNADADGSLAREFAEFRKRDEEDHHNHRMKLVLLSDRVDALTKLVGTLASENKGLAAAEAMLLGVDLPTKTRPSVARRPLDDGPPADAPPSPPPALPEAAPPPPPPAAPPSRLPASAKAKAPPPAPARVSPSAASASASSGRRAPPSGGPSAPAARRFKGSRTIDA